MMACPPIVILVVPVTNSIGVSSGSWGMLNSLRAAAVSQWRREDAQTYGSPRMIVPGVVAVVILVGVKEMADVDRGVVMVP